MGLLDDIKRNTFSIPASPPGTQPPSSGGSDSSKTGLADLARGLQYVVNEAAMAAHLHLGKTLDLFFNKDGTPVYREVQLPDGRVMDVPLIALTPPANLMLDSMEVELAVRIDSMKPVSDEGSKDSGGLKQIFDKGPKPPAGTKQAADDDEKFKPVGLTSEDSDGPLSLSEPDAASSAPQSFASPLSDERAASPSMPLAFLAFDIAPASQSADASSRKDNNIMDIKMVFKRDESPEGVARLVSIFTDAMFRAKDKDTPEKNAAASTASSSPAPAKK